MLKQRGFFYWLKMIFILAILGTGFFYSQIERPRIAQAVDPVKILISEVQIYPTQNRFIELYNPNSFSVDLTNWYLQRKTQSGASFSSLVSKTYFANKTIPSLGYFLISRAALENADIILDSLTITESNTLQLKNSSGEIVDKVGWGAANDCESGCAAGPIEGQSMQRKYQDNGFVDTDNNANDFSIQTCPSPKASEKVCQTENDGQLDNENNNATTTPEQVTNPVASSTENIVASPETSANSLRIKIGDVLINEFVSDPGDNDAEWIELYNRLDKEVDLGGWWIEDGSGAKTELSGTIPANGFKVIEKPSGMLNNGGDLIIIYDLAGRVIDQVAYGNWADGDLSNNAPVASDPNSVARIFDGYNTFNNANDFAITIKPTKGASNVIQADDEVSPEAKAKFDFSGDIYLSEILPNPDGYDAKLEFIEIFNAGKREVNLTGWSLSNEDNKKAYLEKVSTSTMIKAGEYLILYRPKTKIVLHNDQGEVKLFQPLTDKPLQTVAYKNVKEGWSYNLMVNPPDPLYQGGEWEWSDTITSGAANVFKIINHAPEVAFNNPAEILIGQPVIFDSSDTMDADGDQLKYEWDFGDGIKNSLANPEHTYLEAGVYIVKLAVSDGKETAEKEKSITVVNNINEIVMSLEPQGNGIIINEIFPNPAGADTGQEWLELKNQGIDKINLLNWRVENSNGKFKFKNDLWLEAEDFYLLGNAESKLAFKNSSDVINLYNDLDELIDKVEYSEAVQGESYARGENGKWFWTTKLTPAEANIISLAESEASVEYQVAGVKIAANSYVETTLEKIKELAVGSFVKVKGTVAVEPGILGAQIFYVVGSPGIQVYNYKKDFPVLHIGDYIEAAGELSQTQGELRIKTKDKADIKILEHKIPPSALALSCDAVNEENIGQLVSVSGQITDKKSSTIYLDDGNDEILVYIKKAAGIDTKNLVAGQTVTITGIIGKTVSGLRLLPRSQDDIVKVDSNGELSPQVLGEVASGDEWEVASRDKKMELFKYLLILAGGGIIIMAGLLIRLRKKE